MIKILGAFFLFFVLFIESSSPNIYSFADNKAILDKPIKIISRAEWGANESYRYADGPEWIKKFEEYAKIEKTYTKEELESIKKDSERRNQIDSYLMKNYKEENTLVSTIREENGRKLMWPIQKTKYVKAIIVHHTDTFYSGSIDSIQQIYKYHALTRGWGDIGYNYLIGYDGEIFEGRAGGDYAVGAHALRNNRSTIGISVIGYYQDKELNAKQKESLDKLIKHLVVKYGIDLSKKYDYHRDCREKDCKFYVTTDTINSIVGHRDAGHTTCPGQKVYDFLDSLIKNNLDLTKGLSFVENKSTIKFVDVGKTIKENKIIISDGKNLYYISVDGNKLVVNDKKYNFFTIRPQTKLYILLNQFKNSKFSGSFLLFVKNGKIGIINEL